MANDIGREAAEAAVEANPNLSEEVKNFVSGSAAEGVQQVLDSIKSGEMSVGDPQSCGTLAVLFKDKADNQYGVVAMQFDNKGNLMNIDSAAPGSAEAEQTVEGIKENLEGPGRMLEEGYRAVHVGAPSSCGPS